jgi:hypothetical protein
MFEIDSRPLSTTIICTSCKASLCIDTDDRRLSERSVQIFQGAHRCRTPHPPADESIQVSTADPGKAGPSQGLLDPTGRRTPKFVSG